MLYKPPPIYSQLKNKLIYDLSGFGNLGSTSHNKSVSKHDPLIFVAGIVGSYVLSLLRIYHPGPELPKEVRYSN
jgi:hypothetical protein